MTDFFSPPYLILLGIPVWLQPIRRVKFPMGDSRETQMDPHFLPRRSSPDPVFIARQFLGGGGGEGGGGRLVF